MKKPWLATKGQSKKAKDSNKQMGISPYLLYLFQKGAKTYPIN
jgi:hypothetical protein